MPIHGTIEEAGLPDVLQLLALGGKTGCLSVSNGQAQGEIYLESGRISYAEIATRRDLFAEKLVRRGRITREQLSSAVAEQERDGSRPLGHVLVDSGMVLRAEMERLLKLQAEESVYLLFEWKQGQFTFTSNHRPPYHSFAISLDAENLLLEGARRVDEWTMITRKIPSFDLVYRRSGSSLGLAAADLTEEQKVILPLLDGTRDVNGIIGLSGLSEFDAVKALYGLLVAGFAQLLERRSKVRHLEYREVLAYIVREAEFTDADRRKDAARHIADCPECAKRLRNIHVRRTVGAGMPAVDEPVEVQVAQDPEMAQAVLETVAVVGAAAALTLHVQDRRAAVGDRRMADRRVASDRRVTVTANWSQHNVERRVSSRRTEERRVVGGSRRGADRRGPSPLNREPGHRPTEARQMPQERRGHGRPQFSVPVTPPAETSVAASAAATAPEIKPETKPEIRPAAKRSSAPRRRPSTPPPSDDRKSREIVWITSPEESLELVRKRHSDLREAAARATPRETQPSVVVPATPIMTEAAAAVLAASLPEAPKVVQRRPALAVAAAIVVLGASAWGAAALLANRGSPLSNPENPEVAVAPVAAPAAAPQDVAPSQGFSAATPITIAPQAAVTTPAASAPTADNPPAAAPGRTTAEQPVNDRATAANDRRPAPAPDSPAAAPAPSAPAPVAATEALEPDAELAAGGWTAIDRAEAVSTLGGAFGAIPGWRIESITTSSVGGRPRVRVAQVNRAGQRIVLMQMPSGTGTPGGRVRATDVSVSPPAAAGAAAIGTASLGGVFITAKSKLSADEFRAALARVAEVKN